MQFIQCNVKDFFKVFMCETKLCKIQLKTKLIAIFNDVFDQQLKLTVIQKPLLTM